MPDEKNVTHDEAPQIVITRADGTVEKQLGPVPGQQNDALVGFLVLVILLYAGYKLVRKFI